MGPDYLTALIRGIGIPATAGRASAIRQQVLEMPSPVVAAPTATGHPDITDNPGSARRGELATVEYAISPVSDPSDELLPCCNALSRACWLA